MVAWVARPPGATQSTIAARGDAVEKEEARKVVITFRASFQSSARGATRTRDLLLKR